MKFYEVTDGRSSMGYYKKKKNAEEKVEVLNKFVIAVGGKSKYEVVDENEPYAINECWVREVETRD